MEVLKPAMRAAFAAFAMLLASVGVAHAANEGRVVLAISAGANTHFYGYILTFHSRDGEHREDISYKQDTWLLPSRRDFDDGNGNGVVKIMDLPEGEWALTGYLVLGPVIRYFPKADFSIPFTVKAGHTVYIGDYRAHTVTIADPENGTPRLVVYFVVSDQSARDIPIARKNDDKTGEVEVTIPDVDAAHVPLIRSTAFPER